ncbi:phage tail tip lysozyme [Pseudomonas bohemica]|uniref:phage tail tip lysozyme n=1 Tax=Pseudomonas bohemica TaxID=2044872 RepID=UPI000DA5FF94|nr:phage tail tip lysozyme [Pseudomonas bohemica]
MANTFTITISAVDKATAQVRKVNDAISRLTRPFEDVGKSFKSLGRELGFEKIGKNLGSIGRDARGAAGSIGSIVTPLAAITGIGSVAGVAALANNWSKLGRSIENSSRGIGVTAGQLQGFQGAARMVGIDSETTTASLDSLATTMQDAQWGRNQGALLMLNKLGIGLKKTKDGANDVVGEYKAIANAIAGEKNPQVQALIANSLGLGGMLPFLREGAAGIERYEATVKRLGYVMSDDAVRRGNEFSQSLSGLGIAVDGVKNSIGDSLIPAMKPLVDQFSNWLAVNRELIAADIGKLAEGFATWINQIDWKAVGQGIIDFGKGIGKVVDWLGGWQNAALLVVGVMNAGLISSVVGLGLNLARAGIGIASFVGLLTGWKTAAVAAEVATDAATAAAARSAGAGIAGRGAVLGIGAAVAGVGAMFYSPTLNDGEDAEVAKIRARQGLPPTEQQTPQQAYKEAATSKAWQKLQGANKDNASFYKDYLESMGWSKAAANGIIGNGIAESNLDPKAIGDWGRARGIFQWHPDRQKDFENWSGFKITDDRADALKQIEFANYELTMGKEKTAGDRLRSSASAGDAGEIASRLWLRPGVTQEAKDREAETRRSLSDQLSLPVFAPKPMSANSGSNTSLQPKPTDVLINPVQLPSSNTAVTAAPQPATAPQGPYSQGATGGEGGTVKVEIQHKNAPEGTKTKVETSGNVQASSRIAHSGVGAIA